MKSLITITLVTLVFSSSLLAKGNDPVWGSDGSEPDKEIIQAESKGKVGQSAGERALEENPFNPSIKKGNDPVWGSDGSEPDSEVVKQQ